MTDGPYKPAAPGAARRFFAPRPLLRSASRALLLLTAVLALLTAPLLRRSTPPTLSSSPPAQAPPAQLQQHHHPPPRAVPNAERDAAAPPSGSLARPPPRNGSLDCANPLRLGDAYGGWQLCAPVAGSAALSGAAVFTVGVGRNIEWDKEMIRLFNTHHHGWDPTPTALDFVRKQPPPSRFTFHGEGLGERDGDVTLKLPTGNQDSYTVMEYRQDAQKGTVVSVPMLTVDSMLRKTGVDWLAVLKIDIEGAEFAVINSWHKQRVNIPADQVLIEFHERYFSHRPDHRNMVADAVSKMQDLHFDLIVRTRLECTFARREAVAKRADGVLKLK